MSPVANSPPKVGKTDYRIAAALIAGSVAWLVVWILALGVTLINDEYAAIDYFYRIVEGGGFYPTPDKLHKPLSVMLGVFPWLFESALAYELVAALFGGVLAGAFYLVARTEFGRWPALALAAVVALHPDLMYYAARGSTVIPFCALAVVGLFAALSREESEKWLWVYAGCFFMGGLIRPESWLFAGPMVVWWSPFGKGRRAWISLIVAAGLIELAPVIWFGKDWLINGDLLHGINIATRDKEVGTGAPLSAFADLRLFWTRISFNLSAPVTLAGWIGLVVFAWRKGAIRGITHPLVVFPLMVAGYVWLIVYLGVWHAQRYWYFDSVFTLFFCVWLAMLMVSRINLTGPAAAKHALFFAAGIISAILFIRGPGSESLDLHWLMVALAAAALAAAPLLVWPRLFFQGLGSLFSRIGGVLLAAGKALIGRDPEKKRAADFLPEAKRTLEQCRERLAGPLLVGALTLFCLGLSAASLMSYTAKIDELAGEAAKQREMVETARILNNLIPEGHGDRIMIPSRRNEQLNWLLREREILDAFFFREAFYLDYYKGIKFYELHPDWIVYVHQDFQFRGPREWFVWFEHQDRIELKGVVSELMVDLGETRIFKVTYPEGHPEKGPMPEIP